MEVLPLNLIKQYFSELKRLNTPAKYKAVHPSGRL
jgi:hypothetical protein